MGVDPRYIAIAASTPPDQMHFLNQEELDSLKVNWSPKTFEPWSIEPSGRGIIAFTKSRDKTETAVLFCRSDKVPRLLLRPDRADFDWYQMALKDLETVRVFGINVPKIGLTLKKINGAPALEVSLPSLNLGGLNYGSIGVGIGEGPRYLWSGFNFDLPLQNATQAMALALRNCI
jgi:hypothetical protein